MVGVRWSVGVDESEEVRKVGDLSGGVRSLLDRYVRGELDDNLALYCDRY